MDIEVISRETIKPSSPTLPHLRIYPLSFFDHVLFRHYIPVVYFYEPTSTTEDREEKSDEVVKKSLSQVLAMYYPLAGRIRDRASIDCNDEGATLLVTRIKYDLSGLLRNPKEDHLKNLFPHELPWKIVDPHDPLLVVQVNHFVCGGIAISVCVSHKVADGCTIFNFVKDWATIARKFESSGEEKEGEERVILPRFDGASIFPLEGLPNYPEIAFARDNTMRCKRFILDASKIQSLKATISQKVKNPTRVQVVSAVLYKSAVSALSSSSKSSNQPSWLCSWANLRTRMLPPVPEKTIGNMIWCYIVSATMEEGLNELVYKLKHSLTEFCDTHVEQFGRKDKSFISEILQQATSWDPDNTDTVVVDITSWCRFPLYEADFGWGKPIWVTTTCCPHRNCMFLKDTRDGDGIEVLVNMEENEMALFEHDVLQYASVYPGI
ncbi:stemmadenine O-acetyltransferase-like [Prosopis cineraria]|uniref:stemmadenine O-acetyltransferase-like n=1 Tax=Prosopis cineraria TaxID=364024 RepID=UPI00240F6655|nr:stemmadenine O-acetyltransferase-like [Prosopis cineraria]